MRYRVGYTSAAARLVRKLAPPERRRLLALVAKLADDPRPRGCKKLSGRDAWRIRQGDYRVIYEINDGLLLVTVVRAGHGRDVYDR